MGVNANVAVPDPAAGVAVASAFVAPKHTFKGEAVVNGAAGTYVSTVTNNEDVFDQH